MDFIKPKKILFFAYLFIYAIYLFKNTRPYTPHANSLSRHRWTEFSYFMLKYVVPLVNQRPDPCMAFRVIWTHSLLLHHLFLFFFIIYLFIYLILLIYFCIKWTSVIQVFKARTPWKSFWMCLAKAAVNANSKNLKVFWPISIPLHADVYYDSKAFAGNGRCRTPRVSARNFFILSNTFVNRSRI